MSPVFKLGSASVGLSNAMVVARIGGRLVPPAAQPPIGPVNLGNHALTFLRLTASGGADQFTAFARGLEWETIGQLDAKFPIHASFSQW